MLLPWKTHVLSSSQSPLIPEYISSLVPAAAADLLLKPSIMTLEGDTIGSSGPALPFYREKGQTIDYQGSHLPHTTSGKIH
jgi:hypothetical protein